MSNEVLKNDTAITLDWADVTGANKYHIEVASTPDFSGTLIEDDNTLVASTHSFTDGGTDDTKRWWRWRYSTDGGTTWASWNEVGSYWLDTGAAGDVSHTNGQWKMFDPDLVTDIFTFDDNPVWVVREQNIYRAKDRNRSGELLSEYNTTKSMITLSFGDDLFMTHQQMREFKRFNVEIKTFFLSTLRYNGTDYVPHIWKVQFQDDPELTMIRGRQDFFTGELLFEEV